jgi:chromosome segregation ATPase
MSIEEIVTSLKDALSGKSAEVENAHKEVLAAKELAAASETKLSETLALVDGLTADKNALLAKITALEASVSTLASEKEAISKQIESAGKKAASIVASAGVDPVEVSPVNMNDAGKSDEEISKEWVLMKEKDPKGASEFYTKNRAAIIRAAGIK